MSDRSYGLIGEGEKDIAVYQELIAKIFGSDTRVVPQSTGGNSKKSFLSWKLKPLASERRMGY